MNKQAFLLAFLFLSVTAYAAACDPTKFGGNNITTVWIGGCAGNGTFLGNVTAINLFGFLNASYILNAPWTNAADYYNKTVSDQRFMPLSENTTIWTAIGSIGNWTLDKPAYTVTNGLVAILGNWSSDKSSYTATNGLVALLGNWSNDKSNYTTTANLPIYNNGTSNLTIAQVEANLGNWSGNKSYYYNASTSDGKYIYNVTKSNAFNNSGGLTSNSTLDINSTIFQRRFGASCTTGIGYVDEDGTVHCSNSQTVGFINETQIMALGNLTNYYNKTSLPTYNNITNLSSYYLDSNPRNYSNATYNNITNLSLYQQVSTLPVYNNITNLSLYQQVSTLPTYNNITNLSLYVQTSNFTTIGNWTADKGSYVLTSNFTTIGNYSAENGTVLHTGSVNNLSSAYVEGLGNLTNYYNKTTSDGKYLQNGTAANLTALTITGGNLNVTAGNITYIDRNSKTRVIQDTTQGMDEMKTNTLLDKSRSTLTCAGSQLNYTLVATNSAGEWNFGGVFYGANLAVANASITLLNGTNSTPKVNHVYFYLNGATPTLAVSESIPTGTVIDVATFVVGETVNSSCVVYSYSRDRQEIDTFVNRVITRFAAVGTLYNSGFNTSASTKSVAIAAGSFYNGIFYMFSNLTKNSTTDSFYMINSTGNFNQYTSTDGATFSKYQTGEAVTDNRLLNVIWGVVPTTTTASGTSATVMKIVAVLQSKPSTEYNSVALAEQDLYEMANYYPSNPAIKEVFVPIARTVVLYRTAGGGTGTLQTLSNGNLFRFIAGSTTSSGAPPAPTTSDHPLLTNLDYSVAGHTGFASTTYADSLGNFSSNTSTVARTGNCTSGQFVVNTTTSGVQCAVATTTETDPKWSGNSSLVVYASTLVASITGNETDPKWSGNSSLVCYATNLAASIRSNVSNGTGISYVTATGVISLNDTYRLASLTENYTTENSTVIHTAQLVNTSIVRNATSNTCTYGAATVVANSTGIALTCATQQGTLTTETDPKWSGNTSTVGRTGNCTAGNVVQNVTATGVQCVAAAASETDPYWRENASSVVYATNLAVSIRTNVSNGLGMNYTNADGIIRLNQSGIAAGTYGGANQSAICSFDLTGRATSCSNTTISVAVSTFTNMTSTQNSSNWISANTTCIIIKGSTTTGYFC